MEESTLALAQSLAKQVKLKLAQNQSESILCNLSLSYKTLIGCRRSTKSRHLDPLELLAATPPSLPRRCRGSGKSTSDNEEDRTEKDPRLRLRHSCHLNFVVLPTNQMLFWPIVMEKCCHGFQALMCFVNLRYSCLSSNSLGRRGTDTTSF